MKKLLVLINILLAASAAPQQGYVLSGPQGSFDTRSGGGPAFGESISHQQQQQQFTSTGLSLPATSQPDISGQFQAGAYSQQSAGSSFSGQGQFQDGASNHQSAGSSFSRQAGQSFSVSNEQSFTDQVAQVSTAGSHQPSSNVQLSQTASQQIVPSSQFQSSQQIEPSVQFQSSQQTLPSTQFQASQQTVPSTQFQSSQQTVPSTQFQSSQQTVPSTQFQSTSVQENFVRGSSQGISRAVGSKGDCPDGQTRHVDGRCVTPEVMRNVFVYAAPEISHTGNVDPAEIPLPKVEHNIVFIRTDELASRNDPIIIPPPQKKHIIYVLNKESQFGGQRVIEVTTPKPRQPEVYFVNYAEGQTPTLPDGTDFETALNSAVQAEGQVIDGSSRFDGHNEPTTNIVSNVGASHFSNEVASAGSDANVVTGSSGNRRGNYNNREFTVNVGAPPRFGKEINNAVFDTNSNNAPTEDLKGNIQEQGFSVNVEATSGFNNEVIDAGFDTAHASGSSSNIRGNINSQEFAVNVQGAAIGVPLPTTNEYDGNTADLSVQDNLPSNNFGVVVSDSISVSPDAGSNTLRSGSTNSNNLRVNNLGSAANNAVPDTSLYGRNQGRGNAEAIFSDNFGSEATISNSNFGSEATISNNNFGSEATISNNNFGSEATISNNNFGSEATFSNNFASASVVTADVQDSISNFNAFRPPVSANNFDSHSDSQSAGPLASSSGVPREATVSANNFQASSVRDDVPQTAYSAP